MSDNELNANQICFKHQFLSKVLTIVILFVLAYGSPTQSGAAVLTQLPRIKPTSEHREYGVEGFELNGFSREKFVKTVQLYILDRHLEQRVEIRWSGDHYDLARIKILATPEDIVSIQQLFKDTPRFVWRGDLTKTRPSVQVPVREDFKRVLLPAYEFLGKTLNAALEFSNGLKISHADESGFSLHLGRAERGELYSAQQLLNELGYRETKVGMFKRTSYVYGPLYRVYSDHLTSLNGLDPNSSEKQLIEQFKSDVGALKDTLESFAVITTEGYRSYLEKLQRINVSTDQAMTALVDAKLDKLDSTGQLADALNKTKQAFDEHRLAADARASERIDGTLDVPFDGYKRAISLAARRLSEAGHSKVLYEGLAAAFTNAIDAGYKKFPAPVMDTLLNSFTATAVFAPYARSPGKIGPFGRALLDRIQKNEAILPLVRITAAVLLTRSSAGAVSSPLAVSLPSFELLYRNAKQGLNIRAPLGTEGKKRIFNVSATNLDPFFQLDYMVEYLEANWDYAARNKLDWQNSRGIEPMEMPSTKSSESRRVLAVIQSRTRRAEQVEGGRVLLIDPRGNRTGEVKIHTQLGTPKISFDPSGNSLLVEYPNGKRFIYSAYTGKYLFVQETNESIRQRVLEDAHGGLCKELF